MYPKKWTARITSYNVCYTKLLRPLPGVSVVVKGTSTGAATDFDGKYSVNALESNVLVFSYIGFSTQEITVSSQITINVILEEVAAELNEVVIVGYGTQRKATRNNFV